MTLFVRSYSFKAGFFGLLAFIVLACGLFSIIPDTILAALAVTEDLDTFTDAVMDMQRAYKSENLVLSEDQYELDGDELLVTASTVASLSLSGEDAGEGMMSVAYTTTDDGQISVSTSTMRLIISCESGEKVDDHNAVMAASYGEWRIFQYDSVESAESAREALESEGYDVSYDEIVTVDDVEEDSSDDGYEEVVSASATNPWGSTKTFNSWGASFVGYSDYVAAIYSRHTDEEMSSVGTVYVAVLDSGVYTGHSLFKVGNEDTTGKRIADDNLSTSYETTDAEKYDLDYEYQDKNGHGTHVSGTIAESTTNNVVIIAVKVLNYEGSGYTSSIINGLSYIVSLKNSGLNIVAANMSVGIDLSSSTSSTTTASSKINTAVTQAYNAGICCVVSAGNSSTSTEYSSPANVSCAFTVSALSKTTTSSGTTVTFASSYSNYGSHVDFSAPGTSIISAGITGEYSTRTLSGTSMAAPHVTAAVALVFCDPSYANYSVDEVFELLKDNATDYGSSGWDKYYGYGMICLSNIGQDYESGYVSFSVASGTFQDSFELTLSYEPDSPDDATGCVIYYSTDENSTELDRDSWSVYSSAITISETTKVSAVAEVTYAEGSKLTHSASAEYTFGSVDLLSNYTFTETDDGYEISLYSGTFVELTLPSEYNGTAITSLGDYFLKGSSVQKVYVPDCIISIDANAFRANTTLTEISFYETGSAASELAIGNHAFYNCTKLQTLDFGDQDQVITTIGTHVFAYVPALSELKLFSITTIGKHAFSYSSLSTLWLGADFESIGSQSGLSIQTVYGYSDNEATTDFLETYSNVTFQDLSVTWIVDLPTFAVVERGGSLTLTVSYSGYGVEFDDFYIGYLNEWSKISFNIVSTDVDESVEGVISATYELSSIYGTGMGGSTTAMFWAQGTDYMGNVIQSTTMKLTVAQSVCTLTITSQDSSNSGDGNCVVYINDSKVSGTVTLALSTEYTIYVEAENGYKLTSVLLNSTQKMNSEEISAESTVFTIASETFTADSTLEIKTTFKDYLTVEFDTTYSGEEHAQIYDENGILISGSTTVARNDSLSFSIVADTGYTVTKVTANGEEISAVGGVYTLENVTLNISVDIEYDVQTNSVSLVYGKDCGTVDWSGSSDLTVGESKTYTVTASDGYALETVTVNSEEVDITVESSGVYSFTITNNSTSEDDLVVEISFKKDSGLSQIFNYFVIFCAIFAVFLVASLVLWIVRRKQDKEKLR